jgi:hypothetical protein
MFSLLRISPFIEGNFALSYTCLLSLIFIYVIIVTYKYEYEMNMTMDEQADQLTDLNSESIQETPTGLTSNPPEVVTANAKGTSKVGKLKRVGMLIGAMLIGILLMRAGSMLIDTSGNDGLVLIDFSKEAYTVFLKLPEDYTSTQIQALEDQYRADNLIYSIIPLTDIVSGEYQLNAKVIKDEYPGTEVDKGVIKFLQNNPGTPIGITWNGGVAFMYNDYVFAESALKKFIQNSEEYESTRPVDKRGDPIHPLNHLSRLN